MNREKICTLSRQVFIRFLKEMKIYGKFKKNLFDPNLTILDALNNDVEEYYVCDSFYWENSPEGEDFWGYIDTMWSDLIDECYSLNKFSKEDVTAIKCICEKLFKELYY